MGLHPSRGHFPGSGCRELIYGDTSGLSLIIR
jgi:hypothetical protein